MGCDIHLYVEFKLNNQWFSIVTNPFMIRNYQLFNALAGARGSDAPLYAIKGFPSDAKYTDAHHDFFDENGRPELDWHSATWLTPNEFGCVIDMVDDTPTEYHAIAALCRVLEREYAVRLIMWFDN